MQAVNNYDKEVFNGDPGYVVSVDAAARRVKVQYPSSGESPAAAAMIITGSPLMLQGVPLGRSTKCEALQAHTPDV